MRGNLRKYKKSIEGVTIVNERKSKVKIFIGDKFKIEHDMNRFLENENVEVIDVKMNSNANAIGTPQLICLMLYSEIDLELSGEAE